MNKIVSKQILDYFDIDMITAFILILGQSIILGQESTQIHRGPIFWQAVSLHGAIEKYGLPDSFVDYLIHLLCAV
jgi:hypothetical protein